MMKRYKSESAMAFIFLMGIVSLFADMTHEGARSIFGDYLNLLGASATIIGFVTGFGELVGYSLRFITGMIADRTQKYWTMTILGYSINVLAIPCLALVSENSWIPAAILIVLERTGKAIRQPAKNTLLSFAASQGGMGKGFAIQEFMDQIGAFLGPMLLFVVLSFRAESTLLSDYALCFAVLGIPALCCLTFVLMAKTKFPHPETFEKVSNQEKKGDIQAVFIGYMIAISLFAFGFMDFPLVTMHAARSGLVANENLPLLYAGAMLVDAFAALIFGWLFDKYGLKSLMLSTLLSAPFALFVFTAQSLTGLWIGIVLWGIGMGAQESTLKSAVSSIVPKSSRSTGFGIFETGFGVAWFLGSCLLGALYDQSITAMMFLSCGVQLLSIIAFGYTYIKTKKNFKTEM